MTCMLYAPVYILSWALTSMGKTKNLPFPAKKQKLVTICYALSEQTTVEWPKVRPITNMAAAYNVKQKSTTKTAIFCM